MNNPNEMLIEAARLLTLRRGDAFEDLVQLNDNWLQGEDERQAMETVLREMQEAAYLLNDHRI